MVSNPKFTRYQRQMLLPEIRDIQGQETLFQSKLLIIGAGGIGSPAALYLAAAGVGTLGIADPDVVDVSNLNRQILHSPEALGKLKVLSARKTLFQFNPEITVIPYPVRCDQQQQLEGLIRGFDMVLDCTDNYAARYAINQACVLQQKPWVHGAVSEFEGQVITFFPGATPCYHCLYPAPPPDAESAAAVMGVTPGIIGILQAAEAVKYLLSIGRPLAGKLLFVDLLEMHFERVTVSRNPHCPVCSHLHHPPAV